MVFVRFEKSEYHVTEEEKTVDITLLTHRPPSRSFSVSLRFRHNSSQGESYAVCIISIQYQCPYLLVYIMVCIQFYVLCYSS